jgi:hypothetical protein
LTYSASAYYLLASEPPFSALTRFLAFQITPERENGVWIVSEVRSEILRNFCSSGLSLVGRPPSHMIFVAE